MKLFEGKTTTERNKIIAAAALGVISLVALFLAFGPSFSSKAPTVTVKVSPTPRNSPTSGSTTGDRVLPTADEQRFVYETTPVDYMPGRNPAPDAGRNIFAFYEPPPPCDPNKPGDCPPTPMPIIKTPTPGTPIPTPPILLRAAIPQNVYAGMPAFKMMVDGDFFTPDSKVYFNQAELPTTFVSQKKLSADVTANMIAREGQMTIDVKTPTGLYSNQAFLMVNPPPKPTVQYIGMIARKRGNNDTAYLIGGSATPFGARLNDVVGGQFRLIDISATEVVFEDVNLGFKHKVPITKNAVASGTGPSGFPSGSGFPAGGSIPGIPDNIPRYIPPQNQARPAQKPGEKKEDVDDKDDPPYKQ